MSFLSKPSAAVTGTAVAPASPGSGLVDPTLEITQPGGPYNYGEGLLTDGAGNWTIAPTLRPYIFGFTLAVNVDAGGTTFLNYQGIPTSTTGFVIPFAANLIGISVSVDVAAVNTYDIEILRNPTAVTPVVVGTLSLDPTERTDFRRDLSVAIPAGSELGARFVRTVGVGASAFAVSVVSVELEI